GDGDADSADQTFILNAWGATIGAAGYLCEADLNRDAAVNSLDLTFHLNNIGPALPAGQLSALDNPVGFAGYVFNDGSLLYTVRHRTYSTEQGRWLERDPAGYTGGVSLYLYGFGSPSLHSDPMGLCPAGTSEVGPACVSRNCPAAVRAALNHTKTAQNASKCANRGRKVVIKCDPTCSAGNGSTPSVGNDINICTGLIGGVGSSAIWITVIHEMVHARQRCTDQDRFSNPSPEDFICSEMEAFCAEPGQDCSARDQRCELACRSAINFVGPTCLAQCQGINCKGQRAVLCTDNPSGFGCSSRPLCDP
ncbi:MAG: hypothetical protein D6692_00185, partial [Planctomycetota bacterium]